MKVKGATCGCRDATKGWIIRETASLGVKERATPWGPALVRGAGRGTLRWTFRPALTRARTYGGAVVDAAGKEAEVGILRRVLSIARSRSRNPIPGNDIALRPYATWENRCMRLFTGLCIRPFYFPIFSSRRHLSFVGMRRNALRGLGSSEAPLHSSPALLSPRLVGHAVAQRRCQWGTRTCVGVLFASDQRSGRCALSPMAWHRLEFAPETGSTVELWGKFLGELIELTQKV